MSSISSLPVRSIGWSLPPRVLCWLLYPHYAKPLPFLCTSSHHQATCRCCSVRLFPVSLLATATTIDSNDNQVVYAHLPHLPIELRSCIIEYLPVKDAICLSATCQAYHPFRYEALAARCILRERFAGKSLHYRAQPSLDLWPNKCPNEERHSFVRKMLPYWTRTAKRVYILLYVKLDN